MRHHEQKNRSNTEKKKCAEKERERLTSKHIKTKCKPRGEMDTLQTGLLTGFHEYQRNFSLFSRCTEVDSVP